MQNTPRTDAEIERISRAFSNIEFVDRQDYEDFCFTELSKHARQLEQELNEARQNAEIFLRTAGRWEATHEINVQLRKERDEIVAYIKGLTVGTANKHWKQESPNWSPFDDGIGLCTQLDNMLAGMCNVRERDEAKLWIEKSNTAQYVMQVEAERDTFRKDNALLMQQLIIREVRKTK